MDEFEFEGFDVPGTTPVPDVVFDKLLSKLTGNELKVLLYIIRRTYGFGKNADAISLSQFREGIKTRDENGDEKVLDEGCGIGHNRTILVALASLEQKGCVTSKKRNTNAGDSDTTIYKLRFKSTNKKASKAQSDNGVVTSGNHVVTPGNEGSYSTSPRWLPQVTTVVTSGNTQETVLQYTDKQETVLQRDTFGASIDDAILSFSQEKKHLEEQIASLKVQLDQYKQTLSSQAIEVGGTPPSDTPLTLAGSITVADGGNSPAIVDTSTDHNASPEPVVSPTMPLTESQGIVAPPDQDKPPVGEYSASETPSSTQVVKDMSNQATEQGKQANDNSYSPKMTTNNQPAENPPATKKSRGGKKEAQPKPEKPQLSDEEKAKEADRLEKHRIIYNNIVQRRGGELDPDKIGLERKFVNKLIERGYTPERVERFHQFLEEDDWRYSKVGDRKRITAQVIFNEARTIEMTLADPNYRPKKGNQRNSSVSNAYSVAPASPKASMTHDEACKLAHDAIVQAKQYGYDIQAQAVSSTKIEGAWLVKVKWENVRNIPVPLIKTRKQWQEEFQSIHEVLNLQLTPAAERQAK